MAMDHRNREGEIGIDPTWFGVCMLIKAVNHAVGTGMVQESIELLKANRMAYASESEQQAVIKYLLKLEEFKPLIKEFGDLQSQFLAGAGNVN